MISTNETDQAICPELSFIRINCTNQTVVKVPVKVEEQPLPFSCCLPEKKTRNPTSGVTRSRARGRAQVVYYLSSARARGLRGKPLAGRRPPRPPIGWGKLK